MSPLPPPLPPMVALLALLGAAPLAAAEMSEAVWHRALISQAQLDAAATSERFQVADEILCAALANAAPWCHLLTHEGTTCVLYDVVVDSLDDAAADAATTCRTRHRNVCIVEGEPLPHGAMLVHNCLPALCWNRAIVPAVTVSTACDGDFVQEVFGCFYLHQEEKTWCDARYHCATLGADLAVVSASDFQKLQILLAATANMMQVWVGVKSRMWLDNRDVASGEWGPNDPNGAADECARMLMENGKYTLADKGCSATFIVLCMRPS
ncbi:uncharacterized protein LOC135089494 [Scylla paramamosain]|uniref:uncharacterized protein LOC135089494 n=1 Tax=Scylla paramamosain TaxID=85552 RepID=UPI003083A2D0